MEVFSQTPVVRHLKRHSTKIKASHDFTDPTPRYFSTLQGTQAQTQSQPCKELKMPTLSPPTPADKYLSSFVRHFSNKSLLSAQAHPPPNCRHLTIWHLQLQ